jgi:hypothetical protein
MVCVVKAQFGAGMAPGDLLVASSQAGSNLVAQQNLQGSRGDLTWRSYLLCFVVEVAQSPKTGGIAVKRHGFGENHRKNTPKQPRPQIAEFGNAPKQFLEQLKEGSGLS